MNSKLKIVARTRLGWYVSYKECIEKVEDWVLPFKVLSRLFCLRK